MPGMLVHGGQSKRLIFRWLRISDTGAEGCENGVDRAHNLKVAGSNPAPSTKFQGQNTHSGPISYPFLTSGAKLIFCLKRYGHCETG